MQREFRCPGFALLATSCLHRRKTFQPTGLGGRLLATDTYQLCECNLPPRLLIYLAVAIKNVRDTILVVMGSPCCKSAS